jgi:PPOX class probable F420-dependent enzyme
LQLPEWASGLLDSARVGHLALLDAAGHPRVLPVTYAVRAGAAWTVIDNKPKRAGQEPARIRWLREHPHAAITIDRYSEDWSELQWVQLLGEVTVLDAAPAEAGMAALVARYPQYRADPPPGPLLRLTISRAIWWSAMSTP